MRNQRHITPLNRNPKPKEAKAHKSKSETKKQRLKRRMKIIEVSDSSSISSGKKTPRAIVEHHIPEDLIKL